MPRWPLLLALAASLLHAEAPVVYTGRLTAPEGLRPTDYRVLALTEPVAEKPFDNEGVKVADDGAFTVKTKAGPVYLAPLLGRYVDTTAMVRLAAPAGEVLLNATGVRQRVEFAVKGPAGPLAKAQVHLFTLYGRLDSSTDGVATDAQGNAGFNRLPAGQYQLWVDTDAAARPVVHSLDITPGQAPQRLKLDVPAGLTVRGRVLTADGQPASGWTVAVQSGANAFGTDRGALAEWATGAADCYNQTTCAADGTFALTGLVEGDEVLDLRAPGDSRARDSVAVKVAADQPNELGDVRLSRRPWRPLFDGTSLAGWEQSELAGGQPCYVDGGRIVIPVGDDMSGITIKGAAVPKSNYELTLQGARVGGHDFWCGLTFRVGEDPCSLILGGWGGTVSGLSSIDGEDASQNGTSQAIDYDQLRWYRVRLRVTDAKVEVWLDHKRIINFAREEHKLTIRMEVEPSKPLGLATWRTAAAVRDLRLRELAAN